MKYQEKKELFKKFLAQWNSDFCKIPYILNYILSYPEISEKIEVFTPLNADDLYDSQLEWISLVSQFKNPIETTFFKDYWIPIQKNSYDYFIDLSFDELPLFEVHYFFFEPYRWYKRYIFKDLTTFLIGVDNPKFDFENYFKVINDNRWSEVNNLFRERKELGYAGKIEPNSIEKENLFNEEHNSEYSFQDNCITFRGINSTIIGLLPLDCKITLQNFLSPNNRDNNVCDKVKNIKALIFLIQSVGLLSIDSYSILFETDKDGIADFIDNTFRIVHNDKDLLRNMIYKYEFIKNS